MTPQPAPPSSSPQAVLPEGGLGGHLMHTYENPDLTFNDLVEIVVMVSSGKLEEVIEKLDGQNVFFSFNAQTQELKFARNKGDLAKGGMGKAEVDTKWASIPNVQKAFSEGYSFLDMAVRSLTPQQQQTLFGDTANNWFSTEIVSNANPNVITYGVNVVAPHKFGAITIDKDGNKISSDKSLVDNLLGALKGFEASAAENTWKVLTPPIVQLAQNEDLGAHTKQKLLGLASGVGLSGENTIRDFVVKQFIKLLAGKAIPDETVEVIVKRALEDDDRVKNIKDVPGSKTLPVVGEVDKQKDKLLKVALRPLDNVLGEFAVEVLKTQQSLLALNPSEVVKSLRTRTEEAIKALESNPSNIAFVKQELERLKSLDNISSSMEGIIFRYKGESYKFTGSFAPVNQLLGAFKFGRVPNVVAEGKRKPSSYLTTDTNPGTISKTMEQKKAPKESIKLSELKKQIQEAVKSHMVTYVSEAKKKGLKGKQKFPWDKEEKEEDKDTKGKDAKGPKKKVVKVGALRKAIKESVLKSLRESYETGMMEDLELESLMAELDGMDAGEPTNDGLQEKWAEVVQEEPATPPPAPGAPAGAPPAGTPAPTGGAAAGGPQKDPETGLDLQGVMAKMKTVSDPKEMQKWIGKFQALSGAAQ